MASTNPTQQTALCIMGSHAWCQAHGNSQCGCACHTSAHEPTEQPTGMIADMSHAPTAYAARAVALLATFETRWDVAEQAQQAAEQAAERYSARMHLADGAYTLAKRAHATRATRATTLAVEATKATYYAEMDDLNAAMLAADAASATCERYARACSRCDAILAREWPTRDAEQAELFAEHAVFVGTQAQAERNAQRTYAARA